jgi:hypothetical protein
VAATTPLPHYSDNHGGFPDTNLLPHDLSTVLGPNVGFYPELYGAKGGSTDDYTALQACLTATATAGGVMVLSNRYKHTQDLVSPTHRFGIRGYGPTISALTPVGCSGLVIRASTSDVSKWTTLDDFVVVGDYTAGKDGIRFEGNTPGSAHYSSVHRVTCVGMGRHGFMIDTDVYGVVFTECDGRDNDGDGFNLGVRANATRLRGCRAHRNNGAGYRILGSSGTGYTGSVVIRDGMAERNHDGGVIADYAYQVVTEGMYFESNGFVNTGAGRTVPAAPAIGRHVWYGSLDGSEVRGGKISGNIFASAASMSSGLLGYDIELGNPSTGKALGIEVGPNTYIAGGGGTTDVPLQEHGANSTGTRFSGGDYVLP